MSVVFRKKGEAKKDSDDAGSKRASLVSQEGELAVEEVILDTAETQEESKEQAPKSLEKAKRRRPLSGMFKKNSESKKATAEGRSASTSEISQEGTDDGTTGEEIPNTEAVETEETPKEESPKEPTEKSKRRKYGIFKKKETHEEKCKTGSVSSLEAKDEVDGEEIAPVIPVEAEDEVKDQTHEESSPDNLEQVKKKKKRRLSFSKRTKKAKTKEQEIPDEAEAEEIGDKEIEIVAEQVEHAMADKLACESEKEVATDVEPECQQTEIQSEAEPEESVATKQPEEGDKPVESAEGTKKKKTLLRRLSISRKRKPKIRVEQENQEEKEEERNAGAEEAMDQQPESTSQSEPELDKPEQIACAIENSAPNAGLASADNIVTADDQQDLDQAKQGKSHEESSGYSYFKLGFIFSLLDVIFKQKEKMPDISVAKSREIIAYAVNNRYIKFSEASSIFAQAQQAPRRAVLYVLQLLVKKYPQCFTKFRKRKSKGKGQEKKQPVTETHI